jgi:hypothetical protein
MRQTKQEVTQWDRRERKRKQRRNEKYVHNLEREKERRGEKKNVKGESEKDR